MLTFSFVPVNLHGAAAGHGHVSGNNLFASWRFRIFCEEDLDKVLND